VGLVVPSAALAVGNFDNAVIADYAISHYSVGYPAGECRQFVNDVVSKATQLNVGTGWPDYFAGFENAGAQRITNVADLRKGDIIQSGQTEADLHLHTFIIVGLVSGSMFDVIDSNHNRDKKVDRYNRSVSLSDSVRAYRLGAVSSSVNSGIHDPAIVQRPNGETDVVVVGPSNSLDYYFNALNSPDWNKLSIAGAGAAYSSPAVVQRPNGETNVVVAGSNNSLDYYMNAFGSPSWGKLTAAGANSATSDPAVIQRRDGSGNVTETDVASTSSDGSANYYYNGTGSPTWGKIPITVPNAAGSSPAVAQRPNGETDVVIREADGALGYYFNAPGSGGWGRLTIAGSSSAISSPSVVQRPNGETDVVVLGQNNSLDYYFNAVGSPTWGKLTIDGVNSAYSRPAIIQRRDSGGNVAETDVVVVGLDHRLSYYFNTTGSSTWGKLTIAGAGAAFSSPAVVQRPNGETDVAVVGPSNSLDYYFNSSGSSTWSRLSIAGPKSAY
jgi:hypothetical protein